MKFEDAENLVRMFPTVGEFKEAARFMAGAAKAFEETFGFEAEDAGREYIRRWLLKNAYSPKKVGFVNDSEILAHEGEALRHLSNFGRLEFEVSSMCTVSGHAETCRIDESFLEPVPMRSYYIECDFVWEHSGVTDAMARAFRHIGDEFEAEDDDAAWAIIDAWQEEDDARCADAVHEMPDGPERASAEEADCYRPSYARMLWRRGEPEDVQVEEAPALLPWTAELAEA